MSAAPATPTVVLLHGWLCDATDMRPLAARLVPHLAVTVPDLPGHGARAALRSENPCTIADLADAVLRGLPGPGPLLVVGHSLGGAVALEIAARVPERMTGLVLLDTTWAVVPPAPEVIAAPLEGDGYFARRQALQHKRMDLHPAGTALPAADPGTAADIFRDLMTWPGPQRLRTAGCPVLAVFSGAHRAAAVTADQLPGVRARVLPDSGHWLMLERPDEVAALVLDLAADHRRPAVGAGA
ncbi:alpha/beta fold hydrolase [Nakamurella sp. YIM 132087]|uniref:Alpha/beta fold hydrolase n=1 Tax=Nakamurella alba TaxID=2665158 RepID=A0A7K1FNW2_9ACTN|nr:alpha/beta fold hydrolase [Nakamurella alba]MTD15770.1 alpha/beta fold hydrolase [Nakamurella alba]